MQIEEQPSIEARDYKVIMFAASRPFTAEEAKVIAEKLYEFLAKWTAHDFLITSSFKIDRNQFIIICADENPVEISEDALYHLDEFIRDVDQKFDLGLSDKFKACYLENGDVKTMKLGAFRKAVIAGEIGGDVEVFDLTKSHFSAYLASFLLPLRQSWAGIFLDQ